MTRVNTWLLLPLAAAISILPSLYAVAEMSSVYLALVLGVVLLGLLLWHQGPGSFDVQAYVVLCSVIFIISIFLISSLKLNDVLIKISIIAIIIFPLAFAKLRKHAKDGWLSRATFGALFLLTAAEMIDGSNVVRNTYTMPLPTWAEMRDPLLVSPYGSARGVPINETSFQAVRYPELIIGNLDFVGPRLWVCEDWPFIFEGRNSCDFDAKNHPLAIWSTFVMTPAYAEIFTHPDILAKKTEQILESFAKGMTPTELTSDSASVVWKTNTPFTYVLPFLRNNSVLENYSSAQAEINTDSSGLLLLKPLVTEGSISFSMSPLWRWTVLLFWLPSVLLMLAYLVWKIRSFFTRPKP